ncbi:helix-turn-helix domain-containing protein [Heyndrickxia sp. NPDC080065]|uniref:helix-turn-helix domain-containing protein n=1 Tax=Heyndrickxia sp. NPDC080065 TaxID=3390568 RepID=UPI003D034EC2
MGFGAILKSVRKQRKMSQEEIAEKLHISRSNISKLENDKITLDVQTLVQWMEVTNAKEVMIAALCGLDPVTVSQSIQNIMSLFGIS